MFRCLLFNVILILALLPTNASSQSAKVIPEFTHSSPAEWINSKPLTTSQLKGKVVLIDVWTFACWNCYRSFPWLNDLERRYQTKGLQIIGVHTPEFDHEKVRKNIENKLKEFALGHPIMIDNDFSYWQALENRYWPAFYVYDRKGNLRGKFVGETHKGDSQAKKIEQLISRLLN